MSQPEFDFLTTDEAADLLKVPKDALRYLRTKQTGPPYYKIGPGHNAVVRYPREEFAAWVKTQRRES